MMEIVSKTDNKNQNCGMIEILIYRLKRSIVAKPGAFMTKNALDLKGNQCHGLRS